MASYKVMSCALLLLGLFSLQQNAHASVKCNAYQFGMNALQTCGLQWWNSNHFEKNTADIEPQLTDLIMKVFEMFQLGIDDVNNALQILQPNSSHPLRKLAETGALVEPYILYTVMDAAQGMGMTAEDMKKLGLPEGMANPTMKKQFYQSYFTKSCELNPAGSFINCIKKWAVDAECEPEDNMSFITDLMTDAMNYYCENGAPKEDVQSMMDDDFGQVYGDVAKFFGVVRDPDNPIVFDISPTSMFLNWTALELLGNAYGTQCGYLLEGLFGEALMGDVEPTENVEDVLESLGGILALFQPDSDDGVGVIVPRLLNVATQLASCSLKVWDRLNPNFFQNHAKMFDHLKFMMFRYAGLELSLKEPERGDIRHTAMVYGDPHMKAYKIPGTITCPALGEQTYLSNEFFILKGTAEPACPNPACVMATYVTSVFLYFPQQKLFYATQKAGTKPAIVLFDEAGTMVTKKGSIQLENLDSSVRITDTASGAVFMFSKYRETYQMTVRMSEGVFDNSFGLLVLGCPNPMDISAPAAQRRRRDTQECAAACQRTTEAYRETCNFDCLTTGDTEVANITISVVSLEALAEEKDEEIYQLYATPTTSTSTSTEKATTKGNVGDGGSGMVFLPNLLLMILLAVLSISM